MEPGNYTGDILSAVTGAGKSGPQLVIEFAIQYFWNRDKWVPVADTTRRIYVSLSAKAWPYAVKKLEPLGFNGSFSQPIFEKMEGIELTCDLDSYEGKQREKWEFTSWGGSEIEPVADDQLRLLTARWRNEHQEPPGKQPPPASSTSNRPPPPPPTGDEIPY